MGTRHLLALIALLSLSACQNGFTPQPRATMFPASEQTYLRSAGHWDVLAANEAAAIQNALDADNLISVREAGPAASPFEQAFNSMLTSHLVSNRVQVALNPEIASHHVDYDVQIVQHTDRKRLLPRPGTASAVFAIGVFGANIRNWTQQELALIPVGIGLDVLNGLWRGTRGSITEVVINTRVHDGSRLVSADSRVYYFSSEDQHNFHGQGRAFQVVSSEGAE